VHRHEKAREVRSGALNTLDKNQIVFVESTAEGQDGHFFGLCQSARTRSNVSDKLTPMDFKFHFSFWCEDEAYTFAAGSVDIPPSYLNYLAELEQIGIQLTPHQNACYVKQDEQQRGT
jgi:hypothetical protein